MTFVQCGSENMSKNTNLIKCRSDVDSCLGQLNVDRINKNTYVCSKHFVNRRPTSEYPNPIAALPASVLRREHQGACRRSPRKRKPAPQTQQEASTSNSTEDTFHSTSQQSDSTYEEHDMGDHGEELRTLQDALANHKQDIINLKLQLEAKDGQLHHLQKELQYALGM
ncbi:uncharacterized protein LOC143750670 [Siphateles boraxobius]|uniref:uncharacterized protein LOC143750670 n=1 Tax=Siphateles boraxobius TaxID=180520 RepID=UPI004063E821